MVRIEHIRSRLNVLAEELLEVQALQINGTGPRPINVLQHKHFVAASGHVFEAILHLDEVLKVPAPSEVPAS